MIDIIFLVIVIALVVFAVVFIFGFLCVIDFMEDGLCIYCGSEFVPEDQRMCRPCDRKRKKIVKDGLDKWQK